MNRLLLPLAVALACQIAPALAQTTHDHSAAMQSSDGARPTLPGDDTFGALTEIVAILRADQHTDWSRVSIDRLRDHLLDMDAVAKGPAPITRDTAQGLEMLIDTSGPAGAAAFEMVSAHAPVLQAETGWISEVTHSTGGITWRVVAPTAVEGEQIRALGFFGLLATGAHHQAHHLATALGSAM